LDTWELTVLNGWSINQQGFSHLFVGLEPFLGIIAAFARRVIRAWTSRKHEEYWQSIHGRRQAKGLKTLC